MPSNKLESGYFPKAVTREQSKDVGMVITLVILLFGYWGSHRFLIPISIGLLLTAVVLPQAWQPVAKIWLGGGNLLGTVSSKILLIIIYFIVVTPIAIIRRICGADSMQIKKWKKGSESVFVARNYTFKPQDIEKPY